MTEDQPKPEAETEQPQGKPTTMIVPEKVIAMFREEFQSHVRRQALMGGGQVNVSVDALIEMAMRHVINATNQALAHIQHGGGALPKKPDEAEKSNIVLPGNGK